MRQGQGLGGFLLLALLFVSAPAALAHTFWLVPHGSRAAVGEQVAFDLRIGSDLPGTRTGRLPGLVDTFTLFDSEGARPIGGRESAAPVGHVRVRGPGAAIAALFTLAHTSTLTPQDLDRYIEEEALETQLPGWRGRTGGRAQFIDRFSRCAKSVILVGRSSRGFDRVAGLPFELIPLTDPLAAFAAPSRAGTYELRLLLQKQPVAGHWVKARLTGGERVEIKTQTDARGIARFELPRPGLWLFDTVHIAPAASLDADLESLWASLTVEIAPP